MEESESFETLDQDDLAAPEGSEAVPREAISPRQLLLVWSVVGALLLALLPFAILANSLRQEIDAARTELQQIRSELAQQPTPDPQFDTLLATLEALEIAQQELAQLPSETETAHINWSPVIAAVRAYDPAALQVTSFEQDGRQILLEGEATSEEVVESYVDRLVGSRRFSEVTLRSLTLLAPKTATPTPTPSASHTPTGTPTPSLRDEYEVDDLDPQPIYFGQPQLHNFYPVYDVDKVAFLAKAGRYYRIYTTDLQPGVDTFLMVNVGDNVYVNDDREPGDLSSEVVFQAPRSYDTQVTVKVTNRGDYGVNQNYILGVEEIIPTVTPTPSASPSPEATATPTPRPSPSPTEDLRDTYEPDAEQPPTIFFGESQTRNFYPAGDVDYGRFLAKAGRYYRITTSDLAFGVDTVLSVTVGSNVYVNDDRQRTDLSSEVIVRGLGSRDVEAQIVVRNRGQYGADRTYTLFLEEVLPTPTPTPTSTAQPTVTPTPTPTPEGGAHVPGRLPGLARRLWSPAAQAFTEPGAVQFVIHLEIRAEAP